MDKKTFIKENWFKLCVVVLLTILCIEVWQANQEIIKTQYDIINEITETHDSVSNFYSDWFRR